MKKKHSLKRKRFYLRKRAHRREHEREHKHEDGAGKEGEADSLLSREQDVGLDHDLSQRKMLNCLSHPGTLLPAPMYGKE